MRIPIEVRELLSYVPLSSPTTSPGLVSALKGFLHISFLFWVEVCGWLGYEACDVLQDMLEWAKV